MKLVGRSSQKGSSDTGIVMMVLGIALLISITIGVMSWIKSIKEARYSHPTKEEDNKPVTDPYHEPGAFKVTF